MAKSNRKSKQQAKETRRRAELERQAKAHERRMEEERLNPKPKRRFKSKSFTVDENNCDLYDALEEKLRHPYDVWAAIYKTNSGASIPYMFFADDKVREQETYLNRHRSEVYAFIEETYSSCDLPDEDVCVMVMTNPPDGHKYGAIYADSEAYLTVGKAAGIGDQTALYTALAQLGSEATVIYVAA